MELLVLNVKCIEYVRPTAIKPKCCFYVYLIYNVYRDELMGTILCRLYIQLELNSPGSYRLIINKSSLKKTSEFFLQGLSSTLTEYDSFIPVIGYVFLGSRCYQD